MSPTAILSPAAQQSNKTMRQTVITEYLRSTKKRESSQRIKKQRERSEQQTYDEILKRDCVSSKFDPSGFKIKNFKEKGRGVITTKDIPKGFFVVEYAGELIDADEAEVSSGHVLFTNETNNDLSLQKREEEYLQLEKGCYMYYFPRRNGWKWCCVDATAEPKKGCLQRVGRLINHSRKNANCKMVVFVDEDTPHLILVAKEDIKAGDELLYDYGDRNSKVMKAFPWLKE